MKITDANFAEYEKHMSQKTYEQQKGKFTICISDNNILDFLKFSGSSWSDKIDAVSLVQWQSSKHGKHSRVLCDAENSIESQLRYNCLVKYDSDFVKSCRDYFNENNHLTEEQIKFLELIVNPPPLYVGNTYCRRRTKHRSWSPMTESDYFFAELKGEI